MAIGFYNKYNIKIINKVSKRKAYYFYFKLTKISISRKINYLFADK